ncbi:MAG: AAA family ATPase [Candidatus Eisenbacteria bacterium]|nr:AAA family ATPase [Candidatus Eisenbacteria bacterium]
MKVAFIGSHGVGKTALCYGLAAHLKRIDISVGLVQEVARDCPMPINRETTLAAQSWILHTQIAREIAAAEKNQAVVCDRSVLDNYAYLVHRVGRRKSLDPMVEEWLAGYSLLVKVPIWQRPRFDGVRATDVDFQREIDGEVDRLVSAFGADCFRLNPREPDAWIGRIIKHLELPSEPPQQELFPEDA